MTPPISQGRFLVYLDKVKNQPVSPTGYNYGKNARIVWNKMRDAEEVFEVCFFFFFIIIIIIVYFFFVQQYKATEL
jgi:hypothetical protein